MSRKFPHKKSVVHAIAEKNTYQYPFYTFAEFESRSNKMANAFTHLGITKGTRTLVFVTPRLDFSVITFALFKIGAIPVLIDPGMGVKNLLNSVKQVRPEAIVSIGRVHWIRRLLPRYFSELKIKVSLDPVGGKTHNLYSTLDSESSEFTAVDMVDDDPSIILFTSGGTGIPKGVLYTHGILNAQTKALQEMFSLDENQIDLPGFPLFALFTLAMGMTSVIPDMDPTSPATCDPSKIVRNIIEQQVTFVAGSPAIWDRVGKYCIKKNIQLGSVKQVVMFGAPVRAEIHQMFQKILPFGDTYTPYGATECLPVTLISGSEVLGLHLDRMLQGGGTCIGKAVPNTLIKIIKTSDIPEQEIFELRTEQIGEILVSGQQVTPQYFEMDEETKKAKIIQDGKIWHRMGDIGYLDKSQNLWFLGRKVHRVELAHQTFYPLQMEAPFNRHPLVKRTALVSLNFEGKKSSGLVIERHDGQTQMSAKFRAEILRLGLTTEATQTIQHFFLHPKFPVDVRHNIKIDRLKLSAWASRKVSQNV